MLDVTNIFDKDINFISQKEITDWLINRKRIHNQDIQITIAGKIFNTLDCNNSDELLSKYKKEFDELGISTYIINKVNDKDLEYYVFDIDNVGTITTLGCTSVENFISMNQDKFNSLAPNIKDSIIKNFENLLSITDVNESVIDSATSDDLENEKVDLERQKSSILLKKEILVAYNKGLKDLKKDTPTSNTRVLDNDSFDQRREKINLKIENLINSQQDNIDVKEAFINASKQLEQVITKPGRISTEQEINGLQLYYSASAFPNSENIVKALEKASSLPNSSDIKLPLIDTILKLNERYSLNRDEEDLKIVSDAVERLELNTNLTSNSEIELLKEELKKIDNEEAKRTIQVNSIIQKLDTQLFEIEKQINELTQNNKVKVKTIESIVPDNKSETTIESAVINSQTIDNQTVEETKVEDQTEFINKLESVASEGPIFKDTEEVVVTEPVVKSEVEPTADIPTVEVTKVEDQTEFINKLESVASEGPIFKDTEEVVVTEPVVKSEVEPTADIPTVEETKVEDQTEFINKLESVASEGPIFKDVDGIPEEKPHFIKQVKTASINLITKIRNFDFNQKVKDVLSKLKEYKVATTLGLATLLVASGTLLSSQLDKVDTNITPVFAKEIENDYANNIENDISQDDILIESNQVVEETKEKTDEQKYHEEIEQALEEVMGGAKVHISVDDAINNDNGRLPTDVQLENSWQNSKPAAYYDQNGNNISVEQAVQNSANGEDTVVRMDNENGTVGYINVDQIVEENQTGMSR